MALETSYCTFRLGKFLFGVEASRVQEALRGAALSPVPLAPKEVAGLFNLRGRVVIALDLKERLGLEKDGVPAPFSLIVKDQGEWLGLQVDEVGDVMQPPGELFEEVPPQLMGKAKELVRGVYKLRGKLLMILDTEKLAHIGD